MIWNSEGDRIANALRAATGLSLESGPVRAIVCECVSYSGYRETPMQLRASYPEDTKRATLVHELSHRLISDVAPGSVQINTRSFSCLSTTCGFNFGARNLPMRKSLLRVDVGGAMTTNRHGATLWRLALPAGGSVGVPFVMNGRNSGGYATPIPHHH